jgi:hypothetical protein
MLPVTAGWGRWCSVLGCETGGNRGAQVLSDMVLAITPGASNHGQAAFVANYDTDAIQAVPATGCNDACTRSTRAICPSVQR